MGVIDRSSEMNFVQLGWQSRGCRRTVKLRGRT